MKFHQLLLLQLIDFSFALWRNGEIEVSIHHSMLDCNFTRLFNKASMVMLVLFGWILKRVAKCHKMWDVWFLWAGTNIIYTTIHNRMILSICNLYFELHCANYRLGCKYLTFCKTTIGKLRSIQYGFKLQTLSCRQKPFGNTQFEDCSNPTVHRMIEIRKIDDSLDKFTSTIQVIKVLFYL